MVTSCQFVTHNNIVWTAWHHVTGHNPPPHPTLVSSLILYLTIQLNPWSRTLLHKLIVTQLLNKFSAFYRTRRSVIVFTAAHHWSLSWVRCIQSTPLHPTALRSIQILSPNLRLGLPSSICPSGFPTKILYAFLIPPRVLHDPPNSTSWFDYPNNICWSVQFIYLVFLFL
jgi:hypothetical protein